MRFRLRRFLRVRNSLVSHFQPYNTRTQINSERHHGDDHYNIQIGTSTTRYTRHGTIHDKSKLLLNRRNRICYTKVIYFIPRNSTLFTSECTTTMNNGPQSKQMHTHRFTNSTVFLNTRLPNDMFHTKRLLRTIGNKRIIPYTLRHPSLVPLETRNLFNMTLRPSVGRRQSTIFMCDGTTNVIIIITITIKTGLYARRPTTLPYNVGTCAKMPCYEAVLKGYNMFRRFLLNGNNNRPMPRISINTTIQILRVIKINVNTRVYHHGNLRDVTTCNLSGTMFPYATTPNRKTTVTGIRVMESFRVSVTSMLHSVFSLYFSR